MQKNICNSWLELQQWILFLFTQKIRFSICLTIRLKCSWLHLFPVLVVFLCDILYLTTNKVLVLTTLEESPALTVVRKTEPSFWQHSYVFAVFVVFLVRYFASDDKQSVGLHRTWRYLCSLGIFAVFVVFAVFCVFCIGCIYVPWCNILYLTANIVLVLTTVEDSAT